MLGARFTDDLEIILKHFSLTEHLGLRHTWYLNTCVKTESSKYLRSLAINHPKQIL